MERKEFEAYLTELAGTGRILFDEPMSKHTTFRIGGRARYFVMPDTVEMLQKILECCNKQHMPYFILGNGSNLLVSDSGYDGVVVQLYKNFSDLKARS